MAKLFKNTKSALSFVLAFAVLAVSLFTGVVINSEAAACDVANANVVYITPSNREPDSTFMNGTHGSGTSEADPYIISTPGQLRYIVQKSTTADTAGKFYKIDPTIDIMVLQFESYINTVAGSLEGFLALDAEGTKTALSTTADRQQWQSANGYSDYDGFAGSIDFSGVTICGMYNSNGGLFAVARGATIKNLTVCNNYITSTWYNGNVVGYVANSTAVDSTLALNNIVVKNCYQYTTQNGYANTGVLIGSMVNSKNIRLDVRNILTYGNISKGTTSKDDNTLNDCALYGTLATSWNTNNNAYYEDIVTLDCVPYPTQTQNNQMTRPEYWHEDIYTAKLDSKTPCTWYQNMSSFPTIKQINAGNFTGSQAVAACPNLDWEGTWLAVKDGMPVLRAFHNISLVVHTEKCADCGIEGAVATPHRYEGNTCKICGKVLTCGEEVIYWNGTQDTTLADNGETGTEKDPIIIDSAEELAGLVATAKADNTAGKYFKLADNIGTIVLQPAGNEAILDLADAAAVKAYFESGASFTEWIQTAWEGTSFCGTFDGNGVEIYGMYQKTDLREQGLFPEVEGGSVLKNFALKNSYVTTTSLNYATAFISARSNNTNYGAKVDGIITFDHIALINNYMRRDVDNFNRVGLFTGEMNSDTALVKNCLVAGNDAKYTKDSEEYDVALLASCKSDITYTDDMTEMFKNGNFVCYTVKDSIVLGSPAYNIKVNGWRSSAPHCYSGVYSDTMPELKIGGNVQTFTEDQIKDVTGLTGAELAAACENLYWDSIWLATTGTPELRIFHDETFTAVDNRDGTHTVTCSCGLEIESGAHTFADGVCSVCGAVCAHTNTHYVKVSDADCTTAEMGKKVCDDCGAVTETDVTGPVAALGHDPVLVPGTPAKCTEDGVKNYYDCSRCDAVFEDAAGTILISDLDSWKVIPAAGHTETKDSQNNTVYAWDSAQPGMHFKVCSVCHENYDGENCTGEYVADGANGHSGRCTVCGIETAGVAPHNFDENGSCTTCHWTCTAHNFVDAGPGTPATCVTAGAVPTKCSICGKVGTDRVVDATGHNLEAVEACEGTCSWEGYIAHKYCYKCEKNFAADETDIYSTDYLTEEELSTPIVPENHNWVEVDSKTADHNNGGNVAYKYCDICGMLSMGDKEVDLGIDVEAISNSIQDEVDAAWDEHEAKRDEYDSDEEFYEAWDEKYDAIFHAAFNKAVLAAASANGVTLVTPAKGHTIVKVDEVPATTEKEGTKAHWICTDCGKLYSDAEGTTEVTLEQLVIAKLPATPAESTNTNTDNSNKAPATGETVATAVAAVAAVIAAGFVLVRKSRKA